MWYKYGYPLWHFAVGIKTGKFQIRKLGQDHKCEDTMHVNRQSIFSLRKSLETSGFTSHVWLEDLYLRGKSENFFEEAVRHLLFDIYPFRLIFSNSVWAIAKKKKGRRVEVSF